MALVLKDRVRETTTTTGTGTITLAGAVTGYQSFSVIGNGNTTYYSVVDRTTGDWETGIGTWATGGTLTRSVLQSSNSNALVSFGAGTKDVFVTYLSTKSFSADSTYAGTISSSQVTTALGFTPYSDANPSGYITSSALTPYLTTSTASSTYLPLSGGTLTGSLTTPRLITSALPSVAAVVIGRGDSDVPVSSAAVSIGYNIGFIGNYSVSLGFEAAANGNGANNFVAGQSAGQGGATGNSYHDCIIIGSSAGFKLADGSENIYLGPLTGLMNISGWYNTCVGGEAGKNATGDGNSFLGHSAGSSMLTGANNTIVGRFNGNQLGLNISTLSNYIVLSDGAGNPRLYSDGSGNINIPILTASKAVFTDASKNLTTTGTLGVGQGGTGATTLTGVLKGNGASAFTAATAGTDYVTPTGTETLSGKTLTGLKETRVALGANDISLTTGNYFTKTISGITTLTVSNVPAAGTAASFILDLTNGGSAAITWWGVKWAGGAAPTLTTAGRDVLGFFTHDGGTTWSGLVLGKDVK